MLCLIAEQPGRLPATVRSRCLLLRQPLPPRDQALRWLTARVVAGPAADSSPEERLGLARGAPLSALQGTGGPLLAQHGRLRGSLIGLARGELDPVAEAFAWSEVGARLSLDWLAGWLCDLLRLAAAGADARLDDVAAGSVLAQLAPGVDQISAHGLLRRVFQAAGLTDSTANPQLMLESLLVEWSSVFVR
jgi:DNA polymerase-3 subunit delta'